MLSETVGNPAIYSFSEAPWFVRLHLWVAVGALVVGAVVLSRKKGNAWHRLLGRLWVFLMLTTAISSFFIQARDRFSLIHLFSVFVLLAIPTAVIAARRKAFGLHRKTMIGAYVGLCITGAFTLLPYRMLGQLLFG